MEITNNYKKDDIINNIYKIRNDIKKAKRGIENAEFRLDHSSSNDDMWIRIKEEETKKFDDSHKQFIDLYAQLIALKHQYSKEEYESLLQQFGIVIAITEDINHVEDSLHDERDLQQALDQTSDMIQKKRDEIVFAKEINDEDMITILSAELSYYENDMRKHHWGESRLEILNSDDKKTK